MGNLVIRNLPFISKKIRQIANPKDVFARYGVAIQASHGRTIRRPKQLHIQLEDDAIIKGHIQSHFTADDEVADTIPGSHKEFAENDDDASYVADVLLRHIRKAYVAISRPNIRVPEPRVVAELPDRLIVVACSHGKREGGDPFKGPAPVGWIPDEALRQRIISRSSYVYSLIRDAKLADGFEKGGNRAHQPANLALKYGPDLGGISVIGEGGSYLPAFHRYNGRFFPPVTDAAWAAVPANREQFRVLIMSGLYGLIEPDEWIQNYDVHLTDTNEENGISVASMWREHFTECIQTYVRNAYRGRKVKIFNLLSDRHYVHAVQWQALPRDCSVFHLASPTLSHTELLPPAGVILNSLLLEPGRMETLERDNVVYQLSDFGIPPAGLAGTEIVFEQCVGMTSAGARFYTPAWNASCEELGLT